MVWCLWCLSRCLLMASFIIFRTVWLRWFMAIGARHVLPRTALFTLSQHISSSGSAYACAGVCISSRRRFPDRWILLLDYLLFPTLVAVLGGVAGPRYFTATPSPAPAADLCGYWHRSQLSRIQQTAKFDKLLVFIQLGILAIRATHCPSNDAGQ